MTTQDIFERLTDIFHDVFDDDDIVLSPEMTADDIDDWDSLSHIRLIVSVEKAFGISFSSAEVADVANVGEFVSLIERKGSN